jgi:hypothetical protein
MPLTTFDVAQDFFVVTLMPFIIWANLRNYGFKSPVNEYLWAEHTNLMRCALVILALITANSALRLMGYFDLASPKAMEIGNWVIGVPFGIASVVIICLTIGSVLKVLKARRAS